MDQAAVWAKMNADFTRKFRPESWGLYSLATLFILLRYVSRIRRSGFGGVRSDDYVVLFAWTSFTLLCYSLNNLLNHGSKNNLMSPEVAALLSPSEVAEIVNNMKWVFAQEHLVLAVLWSSKTVMLIIYWRITEGLKSRRWIFIPAAYAVMTFVGSEFALFFSCYPTHKRWDVPSTSMNCSHYVHYQLILAVLNVTSSAVILAVGMPIIISLRLAPRQKCIVTLLFGLGVFDIIASALKANCVLNVTLYGFAFMSWYMRESTVALLVCNLPFTWSLISDLFPSLKKWASATNPSYTPNFWPGSRSGSPLMGRVSQLASKKSWSGTTDTRASGTTSPDSCKTVFGRSDSTSEKGGWDSKTVEVCEKAETVSHTTVRPGSVVFVNVEKVASKDFARNVDLEKGELAEDRRSWTEHRRSSLVTAIDDEPEDIYTVIEESEEKI